MQLFGEARVHPEYSRRWFTLFSFEIGHGWLGEQPALVVSAPGTKTAGFPSMKRGKCTPAVPTYPTCSSQSLPIERCTFRFQSCAYGSRTLGWTTSNVMGSGKAWLKGSGV